MKPRTLKYQEGRMSNRNDTYSSQYLQLFGNCIIYTHILYTYIHILAKHALRTLEDSLYL